jgi:hypothetical protein
LIWKEPKNKNRTLSGRPYLTPPYTRQGLDSEITGAGEIRICLNRRDFVVENIFSNRVMKIPARLDSGRTPK